MNIVITPKKALGQHFLIDAEISSQIANLLRNESLSHTVLEVGAGTGSLTDALLKLDIPNLYLVEIDHDLIPYLKKKYPPLADKIIAADFLTLSLIEWFKDQRLTIIGNFPYNISSQIFFKILSHRHMVDAVVGMVQKEVAQRLTAQPGNKVYGIPSVLLQAYYTINYCFTVPAHLFLPPPKVESAVITMHRNHLTRLPCNELLFFKLVKSGFQQRRKKLHNALRAFKNITHVDCANMLHKRAEELHVEEFIQLTNAWEAHNRA